MEAREKPFDVFISHSSADRHAASLIKQHLQSQGLRCWKAPDDILPGESWPQAILRAIGNSDLMLLVWTGNATTSQEVGKELTLAMRNNLTVVPFRLENVAATGEWEYHLANTHWMDAFDGKLEDHLGHLTRYLLRVVEPQDIPQFQSEKQEPTNKDNESNEVLPREAIGQEVKLGPAETKIASNPSVADLVVPRQNSTTLQSAQEGVSKQGLFFLVILVPCAIVFLLLIWHFFQVQNSEAVPTASSGQLPENNLERELPTAESQKTSHDISYIKQDIEGLLKDMLKVRQALQKPELQTNERLALEGLNQKLTDYFVGKIGVLEQLSREGNAEATQLIDIVRRIVLPQTE